MDFETLNSISSFFSFFLNWPHLQQPSSYSGCFDNLKASYSQDALEKFIFAFCPSCTVTAR